MSDGTNEEDGLSNHVRYCTFTDSSPSGLGEATAGRGEYAEMIGRSIVSMGISSIFLETHPDPSMAK